MFSFALIAGTKFQKQHTELVRWDLAVCASAPVRALAAWDPAKLTTLHLVDANLTEFHVGALVGLRDLSLARNAIASTLGRGLEALPKLRRLNLAGNRLASHKMLRPLPLCAALLSLTLSDNRELGEYRALVIFLTRHLAGTNRAAGLQEVDGKPVALSERIAAVAQFDKKKHVAAFALETQLVNYLGRAQLRDAKYMAAGNHFLVFSFLFDSYLFVMNEKKNKKKKRKKKNILDVILLFCKKFLFDFSLMCYILFNIEYSSSA